MIHDGRPRGGPAIAFHDFGLTQFLDWGANFHEQTLGICINLHGAASFRRGATAFSLSDNEVAVYTVPTVKPAARREPGGHHCFYTLEFSCEWLRRHLGESRARLKPEILRFIGRPDRSRAYVEILPLPPAMIPMRIDLMVPPVPESARDAWYFGKLFEILASTVFKQRSIVQPAGRRNRERVERARCVLDRDFEDPPSLEALGREVGCSAFYLSRMFKAEFGVSIPYYVRARRMEVAAEYLRQGKAVTDTAMAVGYSNVSAFIKAFRLHHCTTPSRWVALWDEKAG